jgi:hypothetical protein
MLPGGGGRASHGSAEAIHSRPTGGARPSHEEPDPIEPQRRTRSSTSPGRSRSRGVAPIARTGPTFDLSTPRAKPIANLTASLAGFGHDPLRERVHSGTPEVIRPSKMDEQAAHEDYTMEWSQSGECLRGRRKMTEFQEANAGSRPQVGATRAGKGGVVGGRGTLDYGGGREVDFVLILELRDGKVFRETRYYADPFEASDARARWFERMER